MKTRICIALCTTIVAACAATPSTSYRPNMPLRADVVRTPADGYDAPPRLVSGNSPVYPITQRMKGANGHATVEFTITAEGTTTDFAVVEADHAAFGTHAIVALREWRYEPARKDGRAVPVRARYTWQYGYD